VQKCWRPVVQSSLDSAVCNPAYTSPPSAVTARVTGSVEREYREEHMRPAVQLAFALIIFLGTTGLVPTASQEAKSPPKEKIAGLWRMCYEPGLEGVSEIDYGYLMLLPDARYVKMGGANGVVGGPRGVPSGPQWIMETGTYEIVGDGVVLHGTLRQAPDGKATGGSFRPWALHYDAARAVVFGSQDKEPSRTSVLRPGPDANYGFAKIL